MILSVRRSTLSDSVPEIVSSGVFTGDSVLEIVSSGVFTGDSVLEIFWRVI